MNYYNFSSTKAFLRQKVRSDLRLLGYSETLDSSEIIAEHLANQAVLKDEKPCMALLYSALPLEVDVATIIQSRPCHRYALPRVVPGQSAMECRRFTSNSDLAPGSYGILEPQPGRSSLINVETIDVAVIPGCAFSMSGQRLGQGGGYYDRLMARPEFRAYTIGICFECQFFDQLPTEPHDCEVDCVITEAGVRWQRLTN